MRFLKEGEIQGNEFNVIFILRMLRETGRGICSLLKFQRRPQGELKEAL